MKLFVGLSLSFVVIAGCKKKKDDEDEPPPRPTDWKAQLADVLDGDFKELCTLRYLAETEKATDAVKMVDEAAAKWKAASLEDMRKRTATAKTDPKIVALLEKHYAQPGDVCEKRFFSVGSTTTSSLSVRSTAFDFKAAVLEAASKSALTADSLAGMLRTVAGPWPDIQAFEGKAGQINLQVELHNAGLDDFVVLGEAFPVLAATTKVTIDSDELPIGTAKAEAGTVQYTAYTSKQSGMTNRSDAYTQFAKTVVADVGAKTATLIREKLGVGVQDPAWDAFHGTWSYDNSMEPTGNCTDKRKRELDILGTFSVDGAAHTIDYDRNVIPAKIVDGRLVAIRKADMGNACITKSDRFSVDMSATEAKLVWTVHDEACKPCTWGLESKITRKQ
jgi:hypothetical protein